jgi:hypothetical protein
MTKDHIISEIRRTAGENRGVPLGQGRFFTETGIKQTDWMGKFWARWSDAVREAGFQPNQLNSALTDDFLLRKLAGLVKELNRFPVAAELRLKARSDADFPSHNTFRRFGGKAGLAARLRAFSLERGFHDVVSICEAISDGGVLESEQPLAAEAEIGYVYMLKSGRFYKIGRTNAVGRRERELAIQLPEKSQIVHSIKTDDPPGIEGYWHRRFEARRRNGEWFELTAADLGAFKRRKFM